MARIRSIKPELLEDEKTASLDHLEWRLFVSCLLLADDHGNFRANPDRVKTAVLWRHLSEDVANALDSLARVSLIKLYDVDGQRYAHVNGWKKHQKVDHPGKPACPGPEFSRDIRETLAPERRGKDLKGEEGKREDSRHSLADLADRHEPDSVPPPPLAPKAGEVWGSWYWRVRFGIPWQEKYQRTYGDRSDTAALTALTTLLEDLGRDECLRCQAVADRMFAAYLANPSAGKGKHPLLWFVERFGSLRIDAAESAPPAPTPAPVRVRGNDPETEAMLERIRLREQNA